MASALFERLTGNFLNGIPLHVIPSNIQIVYSIQDSLQRIFSATYGNSIASPDFGFPVIYDTYSKLPASTSSLDDMIRKSITDNEPRIKEIYVTDWNVEKKYASLSCILLCVLKEDSKLLKYRLLLRSMGGHKVELYKKGD